MEAAILIAGTMVLMGLWSVASKLGDVAEQLRETNSRIGSVSRPLRAIRRAVAPTEFEVQDDEPKDDPGDIYFVPEDPPLRLYRELRHGVYATQRIASSLERLATRKRPRPR